MSQFENDAIFWVELEKIRPNPYQPRTDFDEARLKDLAESIRQYGVLSPLIVTRHEETREDGGISTYYELIAGERRLRASKLAGLSQVPVIIRSVEESDREKLELAIIENLQREDLNAIDRARAFDRLAKEFKLNNAEIGRKIGRSREYVSNSLRLLALPQEIQNGLRTGAIYEGHARALLMLEGRPEEMMTVFRDAMVRKLSVREVEKITREIAWDRARKRDVKPEIEAMEREFAERLGTKVEIREQEGGGKLIIDFFSPEELAGILSHLKVVSSESGIQSSETKDSEPGAENPPKDDSFSVERFSI
ncbi:MAG: ParB/RepB/Spo0J family partition protein [Patescibacteria group bacterium]